MAYLRPIYRFKGVETEEGKCAAFPFIPYP